MSITFTATYIVTHGLSVQSQNDLLSVLDRLTPDGLHSKTSALKDSETLANESDADQVTYQSWPVPIGFLDSSPDAQRS